MTGNRPNVLFLSVDSLRADRTGIHGYTRPTTLRMDQLAAEGIDCTKAFSLGPFTQSACVQMLTGTRPLSYGGYDRGAVGRPGTLFRTFKRAGYRTVALSTLHWVNRYFGYGDGLDAEYQLFSPLALVGAAVATMRNSLTGYHEGTLSREEMLATAHPTVGRLLDDVDDYCRNRIETDNETRADFGDSILVQAGYDFPALQTVIARHRDDFERDPGDYVDRHLTPVPQTHEWLGGDWRYRRSFSKLLSEAWIRGTNRLVERFDPSLAIARKNRYKSYVDAPSLADKIISILETHDRQSPFFLWTHFMDTHLPYVSGRGASWYGAARGHLEALGYPGDLDPSRPFDPAPPRDEQDRETISALYDCAVRATDHEIGRIVDAVDRLGLGEDTIIAVCGDHGEELGENGHVGHHFVPYEHHIHVPMVFRRKGWTPATVEGLVTLVDIAPTLTSMAGIEPLPGAEGLSVLDEAVSSRDHVMIEMFFGGNCLFEHRPIYAAVRTDRYKYYWKERRDPADNKSAADGNELYDLIEDPLERNNLYRPDHPLVAKFNRFIGRRLAEIVEIPEDRILRAFGNGVLENAGEAGRVNAS